MTNFKKPLMAIFTALFIFTTFNTVQAQREGEIIVYSKQNFQGDSKHYSKNMIQLSESRRGSDSNWNDDIQSIRVGKGVRLQVFSDKSYRSSSADLYEGPYPNLGDWNDGISSFKIHKIDKNEPLTTIWPDDDTSSSARRQVIGIGRYTQRCSQSDRDEDPEYMGLLWQDDSYYIDVAEGVITKVASSGDLSNSQTIERTGRLKFTNFSLENSLSSIETSLNEGIWEYVDTKWTITGTAKSSSYTDTNSRSCTTNDTSKENPTVLSATTESSTTVAVSYEGSVTAGLTLSTGGEVGVPGVGGAESSVEVSIETSFTTGKSTEETITNSTTLEQTVNVDPYTGACIEIKGKKTVIKYDLETTFKKKDNPRETKIIKGKSTVTYLGDFTVVLYDTDMSGKRITSNNSNTSTSSSSSSSNSENKSILNSGTEMKAGQKYFSGNAQFYTILQPDGNLVIYTKNDGFKWGSYNNLKIPLKANKVLIQKDGNFVFYGANNSYLWGLDRKISLVPGSSISLSDSGELLLLAPNGSVLWNASK